MGFKNTSDDETLDLEREAPGTEGASERNESEIEGREAEETDEGAEQRAADDTGDGAEPKDSAGFKKRLAKLTAQRNTERKQREAAEARVAAFEAKERERSEAQRRAADATPEGQKRRERAEAIRQYNDEAYGEGYSDWVERERAERQAERDRQREEYTLRGMTHLKSELEDFGIMVDEKAIARWEKAVGSEIAEDTELLAAYRRPASQQAAIQEATKRVVEGLANPAIKQQGGKPLARIARNRSAVFGSPRSRDGAEEGSPFPENYTAKPPKGLSPAEQAEWWVEHRDKVWRGLGEHRPAN